MVAPDPGSPLVLTLTSKYPTGNAAALYVPEDVSLPKGMKPRTGGILRAKIGFINLRSASQKPVPVVKPIMPLKTKSPTSKSNALTKISSFGSEVSKVGESVMKSNGSVLRKRPQRIESQFYY